MNIVLPELSLVILIGASGSGKSSFARKHFLKSEIVSSDECRGMISDDENDQSATKPAFDLLHTIVAKRLEFGRLTVVDATNVQSASRKSLMELARKYHLLPIAIVFNIPENVCQERNSVRPDRNFGPHVIKNQTRDLKQSLRNLRKEGFRYVHVLGSVDEVDAVTLERQKLWNNLKTEHGPFDIIGDVHGCYGELTELLAELGYSVSEEAVTAPEGRKAIFLGDLIDRGPDSPGVVKLVKRMTEAGTALAVPGNHDIKLVKKLRGADIKPTHGLDLTLAQLEKESEETVKEIGDFLEGLVSHYVLDDGKLVVAHAGMKESMQGRGSGSVREFALYGETTGEIDEFGLPVRVKWAEDYRGVATVVYGHTPMPEPEWLNNTVCIDTGCVFGGRLTALRYPEREFVSVPARETYFEPVRPLTTPTVLSSQQLSDDLLDISDVRGRQHIRCEGFGTIVIPEENASAALEVMSRFAADPKWIVYLPPTMSPSETSTREGFLEYPEEALRYFANQGIDRVVCEEKHMGSRAVVIVGRDEAAIQKKFGILGALGTVLSRSGRAFFDDPKLERALLSRMSDAIERSGFWDSMATGWVVLDCELLPWSAKAQQLLRTQYAPVGASAKVNLTAGESWLSQAAARTSDTEVEQLATAWAARREAADKYVEAYRQYCWTVTILEDYKVAPFHILATEGAVHTDKAHSWHMDQIHAICNQDLAILRKTPWEVIDPNNPEDVARAVASWIKHTENGGEGMVYKPEQFTARGPKGTIQPAVKCRGAEYLRIIYGPEYLLPQNLDRLRKRGLTRKRSLALREFALGVEGLRRFVRNEPLRRVHQCAFGVLALESEPVDPRL